jgi:hypothetical protein
VRVHLFATLARLELACLIGAGCPGGAPAAQRAGRGPFARLLASLQVIIESAPAACMRCRRPRRSSDYSLAADGGGGGCSARAPATLPRSAPIDSRWSFMNHSFISMRVKARRTSRPRPGGRPAGAHSEMPNGSCMLEPRRRGPTPNRVGAPRRRPKGGEMARRGGGKERRRRRRRLKVRYFACLVTDSVLPPESGQLRLASGR